MNPLEEMQNFVRVVEAGSISRAAEQLGVAKSGVSRRLGDLESRLGVRLLNRTTRRSSLTAAGRSYYEGAVRLLSDHAELDAQVSGCEAALAGRLRLAAPLSFGLAHLAPAIDEFVREYPNILVDVSFSDRLVDLVAEGVDLAVRIAELNDSTLHARHLCPIRLTLCASPGYLGAHGTPGCADDLARHHVLLYAPNDGNVLRVADGRGGKSQVTVQPRLVANNGDFLRDMAIAGHGILLSPTFIVWQALSMGDLVPLLPECRPPPLNAYAVYPGSRFLPARARRFIDFLSERWGDNPYWDQL
jgi:DNA-binding transcriptional LysR family regulator